MRHLHGRRASYALNETACDKRSNSCRPLYQTSFRMQILLKVFFDAISCTCAKACAEREETHQKQQRSHLISPALTGAWQINHLFQLRDFNSFVTNAAARSPSATGVVTGAKPPHDEKSPGSSLPVGPRQNPFANQKFESGTWQGMRVSKRFKSHSMGVAHVVLHPRKPVAVSSSRIGV